jgi:hypothetical protein
MCETNPYTCDFHAGSFALKPSICAELFSKAVRPGFIVDLAQVALGILHLHK